MAVTIMGGCLSFGVNIHQYLLSKIQVNLLPALLSCFKISTTRTLIIFDLCNDSCKDVCFYIIHCPAK